MSTKFSTTTRTTPTGPVLVFAGELDSSTAPAARDAIQGLSLHAGDQLIIDLAGLRFCDSSGIAALIAARNLAGAAGAAIALVALSPHLSKVLRLLGLAEIFATHPTAAQAREAWAERVAER